MRKIFLIALCAYGVLVNAQAPADSTKQIPSQVPEYGGAYVSMAGGFAYQPDDGRTSLWPTDSMAQVYPMHAGFRLQAQIETVIKNGIGFAFKAARQTFACDNEPIVQIYQKVLPRYTWSAVSSSYLVRTVSLGFHYLYSPSSTQKVKAGLNVLVGSGNIISPAVSLAGRRNDSTVVVRVGDRRAKVFTAILGLSLRYEITEMINISLEAELQHYDFNLGSVWGDDTHSASLIHGKVPSGNFPGRFNTVNLNLGIGFHLR